MQAFHASAVSRRYAAAVRVPRCVGQLGGDEQRRDFGRERKRRVAGLFFPAILRTDGTVPREECGGAADHRPECVSLASVDHVVASREIDQQNGKSRFIHLDAVPVRRTVEPHVL